MQGSISPGRILAELSSGGSILGSRTQPDENVLRIPRYLYTESRLLTLQSAGDRWRVKSCADLDR